LDFTYDRNGQSYLSSVLRGLDINIPQNIGLINSIKPADYANFMPKINCKNEDDLSGFIL